jgi:hypothetical protein
LRVEETTGETVLDGVRTSISAGLTILVLRQKPLSSLVERDPLDERRYGGSESGQ